MTSREEFEKWWAEYWPTLADCIACTSDAGVTIARDAWVAARGGPPRGLRGVTFSREPIQGFQGLEPGPIVSITIETDAGSPADQKLKELLTRYLEGDAPK